MLNLAIEKKVNWNILNFFWMSHYRCVSGEGGIDGDGDITRPENITAFRNFVLDSTEGRGLHFLMADGVRHALLWLVNMCILLVCDWSIYSDGVLLVRVFLWRAKRTFRRSWVNSSFCVSSSLPCLSSDQVMCVFVCVHNNIPIKTIHSLGQHRENLNI